MSANQEFLEYYKILKNTLRTLKYFETAMKLPSRSDAKSTAIRDFLDNVESHHDIKTRSYNNFASVHSKGKNFGGFQNETRQLRARRLCKFKEKNFHLPETQNLQTLYVLLAIFFGRCL
jgi:hypothetical protein